MGFKELADLDCDVTTALGGVNKETRKDNPISATGFYIGTKQVPSNMSKTGFAALHILKTPKGNLGIWGKTNLDQKMLAVTPGQLVRINYVGKVETNTNPMYKYKVEVDADQTIEVATAPSKATEEIQEAEEASADASEYEEETDVDAEEEAVDEIPPARAVPPKKAAKAPSAAQQDKVRQLLNSGRSKLGA